MPPSPLAGAVDPLPRTLGPLNGRGGCPVDLGMGFGGGGMRCDVWE